MRSLRNMIAFNYGFWIAAFFCLTLSSCISPAKEEVVPQKKVEAYDEINDRMMINVVESDDADLERMREQNCQMEKIIDRLERLNDGLERLTETISVN